MRNQESSVGNDRKRGKLNHSVISLVCLLATILGSIFLISCSYNNNYLENFSNGVCLYYDSIYLSYTNPTLSTNYYIIRCISSDRTEIKQYYFTTEEVESLDGD